MNGAAAHAGGVVDVTAWRGLRPVPTLLAARARMLVNGALRAGRERRAWTVILALVVAGALVGATRVAAAVFAGSDPSPAGADHFLAGVAGMVAGFTLVTAITFSLSAFYFSADLELLLVSPMAARAVLLARLLVQLTTGLLIGAMLSLPVLLAYLPRHGALQWLPWIGVVVVSMAALPLCAGTAITVLAVRVLPARRVRDAGGLLVTVTVFTVTAGNLLLRGPEGFTSTPSGLDPGAGGGVAGSAWLPTGWAARGVGGALRGETLAALGFGVLLIAAAAVALLLTATLLETPYVVGYVRSVEAAPGRAHRRRARALRALGGRGVRPAWLAIARKDLRETLRDPSQLGQIALPLALFALYIAAPGSGATFDGRTRLPAWYAISLTAAFASLFAASGVALRGIGSEGRRLWILRTSPVDVRAILAAKFCSSMVVAASLGTLLLGVGAVRSGLGAADVAAGLVRLLVIVAGLVGLATGLGAVRPRLDWTDPRRSVGVWLSLGFLALGACYLGVLFVILALPYARPPVDPLAVGASGVAALVVALSVGVAGFAVGAARLRALEL